VGSLVAASEGVVEGRVALPKAESAPVVQQRYEIVSKEGTVATNPPLAVVYIEGPFARTEAAKVVQLAQRDLAFIPSLLPVQMGTRVEFPNYDDTFHNVFSFSPAKRFDLGRYRPTDPPCLLRCSTCLAWSRSGARSTSTCER
jgi:plastocyanin